MNWQPEQTAFRHLVKALTQEAEPISIVGGVVRDALLGKAERNNDLDIVLTHSAIPIARRVADRLGWAFYALDEGRDVARLVFSASGEPLVCDIARMRGGSIEADMHLRDFTVNALALSLRVGHEPMLVDVTGGGGDLRTGLIRRVSTTSLADDPVRLLRAVRFAVELGFPIEEATRDQMLRMPSALSMVGAERVRDELWKMLASHDPAQCVAMLHGLGMLPWVLPEVAATDLVGQSAPHDMDVLQHTRRVLSHAAWLREWLLGRRPRTPLEAQSMHYLVQATRAMEPWNFYLRQHFASSVASGHTRAEWLVWHALFHDVGKPETRTVEVGRDGAERVRFFGHERLGAELTRARLEALRFSRVESDLSAAVVEGHMRPHSLHDAFAGEEISRRARFRFFRDVGVRDLERPAGVDVLVLATADLLGTSEQITQEEWRAWLLHVAQMLTFLYSERGYAEPSLQPLVDGHILQRDLGLQPGPRIGRILDQLLEAHAAGEIRSRDEALALAERLVQQDDSV